MLRTLTIVALILAFVVDAVALPPDATSRKRRPPQPVLLTCHVHEWGLFSFGENCIWGHNQGARSPRLAIAQCPSLCLGLLIDGKDT